jgi:anthranilate phosphoribosyltransferase
VTYGGVALPEARRSDYPGSAYPGFQAFIKRVATGPRGNVDLTLDEAAEAFGSVLDGRVTPAQAAAFLVAMRLKGETAAELAGFARALRERCATQSASSDRPLVTCAGGYDGNVRNPNLSLAAAATAAACGAGVVLHSGPRLGPKHGANVAAVLIELGGAAELHPARSARVLERTGIGFFWTPKLCPPWERLRPLRGEVGVRTPLSAVEKLLAPVGGSAFVVGLTHCGQEGSDFVSSSHPRALELEGSTVAPLPDLGPGSAVAAPREYAGAEGSAALTSRALDRREAGGADLHAVVAFNTALRLRAAGVCASLRQGIGRACEALREGHAARTLAEFVAATRD